MFDDESANFRIAVDPTAEFDMASTVHAYELTDDETVAEWADKYDVQYAKTVAALRADIIRETLDGQSTTMTHARNGGMDV
ncbi:hypothetical protein nbrc107696_04310 [Gordonia spumicola]|uniref:Uncharacterized protein n=1 Tax=Gordonia spumicola TaxID=589161 RepID=A0A7I9V3I8_9ACTN|nr:hypothetical protein [Gordonia spumicola]GED99984.1 hypothetical protein nbrc107696_04310 [Gordonia spumicola]